MPTSTTPWRVHVKGHPGSSAQEIKEEPDWTAGHHQRIGFKNREDFVPGVTNARDDEYDQDIERARRALKQLQDQAGEGHLLNFRDLVQNQESFHLRYPDNRSLGWRYVLNATEDWVKTTQNWPANIKKREAEKAKQEAERKAKAEAGATDEEPPTEEHQWKRSKGQDRKHNDAYAAHDADVAEDDTETPALESKYSAQELALLRCLQHEKEYVTQLKVNDGQGKSPQTKNRTQISIDEQDQFSPDNWLPRSSDLIRLTGKHPLNAEPRLTRLFDAGLITPNELHYVRNHGAVPRLLWEFHELDIQCPGTKGLTLSMNELKRNYPTINIPVALACDGNRRKELNMIKKSKGFNWGAGGVSCAYWKGPLLRDVLLSAGVPATLPSRGGARYWVNFEGADDLSEGRYATCIPFEYAMAPIHDVMLAYEMNDVPLPPDHGYPVRLIIPGYVGGKCVKWLRKIWISDKENDSHYHIWDNRVLPAFVTAKDGEFAETLFNHPSTACNEQNLNSVIVKPAQGERILLTKARKGYSYRIAGYAYDGGGHEVQRVEVSLDGGKTWLYCIRKFPDYPVRHGRKFWTWVHWHVDVELSHLLRAKSIAVRCFNVFKNTQPEQPNWNIMGMMNNCWYVVRPEIVYDEDGDGDGDGDADVPSIMFRHPVEPATGDGGWMQPSEENKIEEAKQEAGTPQKQFTREEIEKHDKEDDCWIVVDGKVYDATSVLAWHPGGKAAIVGQAGKVHQETTDEFASIHDGYAYEKLKECILGVVTEKAANFIKKNAEDGAKAAASNPAGEDRLTLQKHRWVPVKLLKRKELSKDTRTYTFKLPDGKDLLGLGTCQHVQIGFHMRDRMLIRSYTPTRPLLPGNPTSKRAADADKSNGNSNGNRTGNEVHSNGVSLRDGEGSFDLTVKTYFPDDAQPGGALSNILDCIPIGEEVEIRGPTGEIVYNGNGDFVIEGKKRHFKKVSLVLGGSGITPGYSLIARILLTPGDGTKIRIVDANKTVGDILLKEELDKFQEGSKGQMQIMHVLSRPGDGWMGAKGHVNADIVKKALFPPAEDSVALLCGPPAMIQKAALPALRDWGYTEDENLFGF